MIAGLTKKALDLGVQIINGVEVESYTSSNHKVQLKTNQGSLTCSQLVVCVNSFAKYLLPELEVQPGRNYVLVTEPIADFKLKGTFHMEEGYIYFRNVENRLLIGGGRHWFSDEESTDDHAINTLLKERLLNLSHELIPESKLAKITHEWTGILGLGNSKSPIIKRIDENIYCGLRLGGMGVAIGSEVGYQLSELIEP
ncbi:MAG: FAD-binding oxidoreductase [Flavobacteriales bacterium]|nr:FAD-binding oxidoreductase [Flavobacteriales bacterium]